MQEDSCLLVVARQTPNQLSRFINQITVLFNLTPYQGTRSRKCCCSTVRCDIPPLSPPSSIEIYWKPNAICMCVRASFPPPPPPNPQLAPTPPPLVLVINPSVKARSCITLAASVHHPTSPNTTQHHPTPPNTTQHHPTVCVLALHSKPQTSSIQPAT
jgi:hypothetical protein